MLYYCSGQRTDTDKDLLQENHVPKAAALDLLVPSPPLPSPPLPPSSRAQMNDVKAKIAEQRGVDPASQVLICGGKTLKDDDALSSSVAAGGFLVLMVKVGRWLTFSPA